MSHHADWGFQDEKSVTRAFVDMVAKRDLVTVN